MKIVRKTQEKSEISTASLPDIIFMLLIFFMVTTVMREFEGLDVIMPRAKMIEKLESKRHTTYIWATKDGLISVDDRIINMDALSGIMYTKVAKNPKIPQAKKNSWLTKAWGNLKWVKDKVKDKWMENVENTNKPIK